MTPKQAKKLSLLVWRYLRDHPDEYKSELPEPMKKKIRHLKNACPLCELFLKKGANFPDCEKCPLGNCADDDSNFDIWCMSEIEEYRQEAADRIVKLVEAWEPGV